LRVLRMRLRWGGHLNPDGGRSVLVLVSIDAIPRGGR
jgi:hypothetical protein